MPRLYGWPLTGGENISVRAFPHNSRLFGACVRKNENMIYKTRNNRRLKRTDCKSARVASDYIAIKIDLNMKKIFLYICFLTLFYSCSYPKEHHNEIAVCDTTPANNEYAVLVQEEIDVNLDSVKNEILALRDKLHLSISDTLKYQFSLEDVGTEGNEGSAYYLNDSIKKIEFGIGTSMRIYELLYLFEKTYIKVIERTYNIANVYSGGDWELIKTLSYSTDWNGIPINKVDSDRVDVFRKLKQVVPFVLK